MSEQITKEELLKLYYDQIKHYLKSDIRGLMESDDSGGDVGCGPYLLSACSGIDFLGTLSLPYSGSGSGLKGKSRKGFKNYITKFLSKVDRIYAYNKVDDFIYTIIRSGQVHEGIVKQGVLIGKKLGREYHLKILAFREEDSRNEGDPRVEIKKFRYFDTRVFAEDFLKSLDYFEELFRDASKIEEMAQGLSDNYQEMLNDLQGNLPDLEEKDVNEYKLSDLYELSSSTPYGRLATLRPDFWQILQKPR